TIKVAAKGKVSKNFDFIGINPPMFRRAIRCVVPGNASSTEAESLEFKLPARPRCLHWMLQNSAGSEPCLDSCHAVNHIYCHSPCSRTKRSAFRISKLRRVMNPRQIQAAEAGISYATALAKIIGSDLQL